MDLLTIRAATDALRDVRNWLAVFKTEYSLPEEAYRKLHDKIEEIGSKMDGIVCKEKGVDPESLKPVTNALRETINWLAVFAEEYDLAQEAVKVLNEQFDVVGERLAAISCE